MIKSRKQLYYFEIIKPKGFFSRDKGLFFLYVLTIIYFSKSLSPILFSVFIFFPSVSCLPLSCSLHCLPFNLIFTRHN